MAYEGGEGEGGEKRLVDLRRLSLMALQQVINKQMKVNKQLNSIKF